MVIVVGCHPHDGLMKIYNSQTKKVQDMDTIKLNCHDIAKIKDYVKLVRAATEQQIDYFCILLDHTYKNIFRKKLIETANLYGIPNIRIIGVQQALLIGAINNLKELPNELWTSIWIFWLWSNQIDCTVWTKEVRVGWKIKSKGRFPTSLFSSYVSEKIKENLEQQKQMPFVMIYNQHAHIQHNDFYGIFAKSVILKSNEIPAKINFKSMFVNIKEIKFHTTAEWCFWALQYGRCMSKDSEYQKYECEAICDRDILLKIKHERIATVLHFEPLPFFKICRIANYEEENLAIYEDTLKPLIIILPKMRTPTFSVDENGIYTLTIMGVDTNKVERNTISEEGCQQTHEKYFIPVIFDKYNPDLNVVGIDFGTTECCAAVIREHGKNFVVLDDATGYRTIPSYVAYDEENPKCGQIVVNRLRNHSEYTVYDAKRIIGKDLERIVTDSLWPLKVLEKSKIVLLETNTFDGKKVKSPEEVSAALLKHIKSKVEIFQSKNLNECVITIPSMFSEKQKEATKKAAEMAGWKIIHFLPEPIAAAFSYFTEIEIQNESNILIFDCGGGTVDICVSRTSNKTLNILSNDGDLYLGGRDFDSELFNHFNAILKHKYGIDVKDSNKKYFLNQKCHDIKHNLSVISEDMLNVDDFNCNSSDVINIKREEFEELVSPLLLKIQNVILQSLIKAQLENQQIDYVFQVGGSCKMPMIKKLLLDIFPDANH